MPEALLDEQVSDEWIDRLTTDLPYYAETMLKIKDKRGRLVPLKLNRAQRIVHEKLGQQSRETGRVRGIILKARQEGVSTYAEARGFRRAHLIPGQRGMVIAHKKEPAGALHDMCSRFEKNLPEYMRLPMKAAARQKHLIWESGSELIVETAGDINAGRASTSQFLHASELAFWYQAADTWISLMQSIPDDDSEVIVESTANGVGGLFYEMCLQAIEGQSEFIFIFLPWFVHEEYRRDVTEEEAISIINGEDAFEREALDQGIEYEGEMVRLTVEQLAWRRSTIANKLKGDARLFRQEYPSTWREAFLVSGSTFFDEEALVRHERSSRPCDWRGDLVEAGSGVALMRQKERGMLRVWEWPVPHGRYVIGSDTAEGSMVAARDRSVDDPEGERGGRDFSCAYVLNAFTRRYVACLHVRADPDIFAEQLFMLGFFYSAALPSKTAREPALIGVERNGASGETVIRLLRDNWRYPNLYYARTINRRTNAITKDLGWKTTRETRGPLLDDFASALREDDCYFPDPDGIRECFTFVRAEDGKPQAQAGSHDDRVIAAAITWQLTRYAPSPPRALPSATSLVLGDSPTGFDYGYARVEAADIPSDPLAFQLPEEDRLDWW